MEGGTILLRRGIHARAHPPADWKVIVTDELTRGSQRIMNETFDFLQLPRMPIGNQSRFCVRGKAGVMDVLHASELKPLIDAINHQVLHKGEPEIELEEVMKTLSFEEEITEATKVTLSEWICCVGAPLRRPGCLGLVVARARSRGQTISTSSDQQRAAAPRRRESSRVCSVRT